MKLNPYPIYLWGTKYTITPYLVNEIFGDGKQYLALSPMFYRPYFYVVRIGKEWGTDLRKAEADVFYTHLDDIYDAIEEQFGFCCDEENEYGDRITECDCDGFEAFPRVKDFSGGAEWFVLDESDLKKLGIGKDRRAMGKNEALVVTTTTSTRRREQHD